MADVFSQYYRRKEDQENFYNSAMMFLAYTSTDDLTAEEKRSWATKMGMAVLLGKNIFNISELLDKEILQSLVGSDFNWLYDLLQALGRGNIDAFDNAIK